MPRRKKNRYRIKHPSLKIEQSLLLEFCRGKSDKEIIRAILFARGFHACVDSFDSGNMEFELVKVRVHEEGE